MLSSREFDEQLQLDNFEKLEEEYQSTKKFFLELNDKIKCDDVALQYPAFCYGEETLIIKFPTYKIRVINNKFDYDKSDEILSNCGNYRVYEEGNVVTMPSLNSVQSTAIHCLEDSLDENEKVSIEIQSRLKKEGIYSEKCVTSGYYCIPIVVDEEGYITKVKI